MVSTNVRALLGLALSDVCVRWILIYIMTVKMRVMPDYMHLWHTTANTLSRSLSLYILHFICTTNYSQKGAQSLLYSKSYTWWLNTARF